jgi:hypothetical protein
MGEEGWGDEGSWLFSLFSRQAGGRLGEEGRGDEGLGRGRSPGGRKRGSEGNAPEGALYLLRETPHR